MEADAICSECSDQGDSDEAEDTLANAVKSAPPKGTAEFERWLDDKSGAAATPALPPPPQDDEDFARWFEEGIASCPSFAEHEELLRECCGIVVRWRARFWQRKNLWARIRRGRRLYKELSEIAPVLVRVRDAVAAFELPPDGQKLVLLDLCSGFGYMAMFLSELLAPWAHKVDKIVLVDLQFAPHNVPKGPQHIDPEHLHADGWPIRLTTSRCDLKAASDRRNLCRVFLSHGAPAMLLGVHLCGTLSIRAVQLYNEARPLSWLALKPCCLPGMVHAQRREVFRMGCHAFPAHEVCVHGKWNKGRWVGNSSHRPASVEEVERKFDKWAGHLHAGVDEAPEEGGHKSLEMIRVQVPTTPLPLRHSLPAPAHSFCPACEPALRPESSSRDLGTNSGELAPCADCSLRSWAILMPSSRIAACNIARRPTALPASPPCGGV